MCRRLAWGGGGGDVLDIGSWYLADGDNDVGGANYMNWKFVYGVCV
jgi:hypothetical protein